jgi:hypothetical protein
MSHISADTHRTSYKLSFERCHSISEPMRLAMDAVANVSYVELSSQQFDFGLDKPVTFAAYSEGASIHFDQLPVIMVAARLDGRDVVVMLYERDGGYVGGVVGASFQAATALHRYCNFNTAAFEWVDEGITGSAPGALLDLYADDAECIAGIDISGVTAAVHHNRAYVSNEHRPQALVDLIEARAEGRIAGIEQEVTNARRECAFAAVVASVEAAA